jgi:hypothetical protein
MSYFRDPVWRSVCCGAGEHGDVEGFCGACCNGTGFEAECTECEKSIAKEDGAYHEDDEIVLCSKDCYDAYCAKHPDYEAELQAAEERNRLLRQESEERNARLEEQRKRLGTP